MSALNTLDGHWRSRRRLRKSNPQRGFSLRLLKLLRRESYCVPSLSETYYVECSGSAATVRYDEARHQPSTVTIGLYVRPEFSSKSTEHPPRYRFKITAIRESAFAVDLVAKSLRPRFIPATPKWRDRCNLTIL